MKKLFILLLAIIPAITLAQELKIAFVNVQEIFMAMPEIADIEKKMADLNEKYQKELQTMQDEYTKKYADFASQQDSLTENIKLRRMQEIDDIRTRINNFIPIAEQDVQKQQQDLVQPVQDKIRAAIKAVGEEKGYTYILGLDSSLFLYTAPTAIDATPLVKSKLGL